MDLDESVRIHTDWWGKCRTCKHWAGKRESMTIPGACSSSDSPLHNKKTTTDGHCPEWDSFDVKAALVVMENF